VHNDDTLIVWEGLEGRGHIIKYVIQGEQTAKICFILVVFCYFYFKMTQNNLFTKKLKVENLD